MSALSAQKPSSRAREQVLQEIRRAEESARQRKLQAERQAQELLRRAEEEARELTRREAEALAARLKEKDAELQAELELQREELLQAGREKVELISRNARQRFPRLAALVFHALGIHAATEGDGAGDNPGPGQSAARDH